MDLFIKKFLTVTMYNFVVNSNSQFQGLWLHMAQKNLDLITHLTNRKYKKDNFVYTNYIRHLQETHNT